MSKRFIFPRRRMIYKDFLMGSGIAQDIYIAVPQKQLLSHHRIIRESDFENAFSDAIDESYVKEHFSTLYNELSERGRVIIIPYLESGTQLPFLDDIAYVNLLGERKSKEDREGPPLPAFFDEELLERDISLETESVLQPIYIRRSGQKPEDRGSPYLIIEKPLGRLSECQLGVADERLNALLDKPIIFEALQLAIASMVVILRRNEWYWRSLRELENTLYHLMSFFSGYFLQYFLQDMALPLQKSDLCELVRILNDSTAAKLASLMASQASREDSELVDKMWSETRKMANRLLSGLPEPERGRYIPALEAHSLKLLLEHLEFLLYPARYPVSLESVAEYLRLDERVREALQRLGIKIFMMEVEPDKGSPLYYGNLGDAILRRLAEAFFRAKDIKLRNGRFVDIIKCLVLGIHGALEQAKQGLLKYVVRIGRLKSDEKLLFNDEGTMYVIDVGYDRLEGDNLPFDGFKIFLPWSLGVLQRDLYSERASGEKGEEANAQEEETPLVKFLRAILLVLYLLVRGSDLMVEKETVKRSEDGSRVPDQLRKVAESIVGSIILPRLQKAGGE